jgi:hypothetical protein
MEKTGFDMYVFRDGRKQFGGRELLDELARALEGLRREPLERDCELKALIAAGELECALRDAADQDESWRSSAEDSERVTNIVAKVLVGTSDGMSDVIDEAEHIARTIAAPEQVTVAVLEGFAFYALHPKKFLDVLRAMRPRGGSAVIGIRSIGAPLSAVVAAAIPNGDRLTVRPTGHPYERSLEITEDFRSFVDRHREDEFMIVDEGPGLSGSSFLAVAEALVQCGVASERITMLGSRVPDVAHLRTPNAKERWSKFRFRATAQEPILPQGAELGIGGGWWRRIFLTDFEDQPASWTQLESSKYLSQDRKVFYKFEGFGHFGEEIGARARLIQQLGFGPNYLGSEEGFGKYEVVPATLLRARDLSSNVLKTMARYCAMREREMRAKPREESKLQQMLSWNWNCEFGEELPRQTLEVERLVTADARMLPHEWISTEGRLLKLDGCSHGDDHFFPGPCDIAWDIAGAIVEWEMDRHATNYFVDTYVRESGDRVHGRLKPYLLAYATFRMGWSKMAAHASAGEFDQQLLERDYRRYRAICERLRQIAAAA